MKLRMICKTKTLNHTDAQGNNVIMVQFAEEAGKLGTLHLYMTPEEAKAFELGSRQEVSFGDAA